jgi:hypothetical protein
MQVRSRQSTRAIPSSEAEITIEANVEDSPNCCRQVADLLAAATSYVGAFFFESPRQNPVETPQTEEILPKKEAKQQDLTVSQRKQGGGNKQGNNEAPPSVFTVSKRSAARKPEVKTHSKEPIIKSGRTLAKSTSPAVKKQSQASLDKFHEYKNIPGSRDSVVVGRKNEDVMKMAYANISTKNSLNQILQKTSEWEGKAHGGVDAPSMTVSEVEDLVLAIGHQCIGTTCRVMVARGDINQQGNTNLQIKIINECGYKIDSVKHDAKIAPTYHIGLGNIKSHDLDELKQRLEVLNNKNFITYKA